jgi:hypothetical protein
MLDDDCVCTNRIPVLDWMKIYDVIVSYVARNVVTCDSSWSLHSFWVHAMMIWFLVWLLRFKNVPVGRISRLLLLSQSPIV